MSNQAISFEYNQHSLGTACLPGSQLNGKSQTDYNHPQNKQMKQFVQELSETPYSEAMAKVISSHLANKILTLNDFPSIKNSYSRTMLSRNKSGMEVLVARWDKGLKSTIHGHPAFAMVYVVEGSLDVEQYKKTNSEVLKIGVKTFNAKEYFYGQGVEGKFDNHIHRIIATDNSLSIHIYSDDALKGEVFS